MAILNLDYVEMGGRIRHLRREQGMTQEVLAERCGISVPFLGHIERGTRKMSLETLAGIPGALTVSADELLFGERSFDDIAAISRRLPQLHFRDQEQEARFCAALSNLAESISAP